MSECYTQNNVGQLRGTALPCITIPTWKMEDSLCRTPSPPPLRVTPSNPILTHSCMTPIVFSTLDWKQSIVSRAPSPLLLTPFYLLLTISVYENFSPCISSTLLSLFSLVAFSLLNYFNKVFRIHNVLIRIRIHGSVPLTYGSWSRS